MRQKPRKYLFLETPCIFIKNEICIFAILWYIHVHCIVQFSQIILLRMTSQIAHPPGPSHTEQFRNSNLVSSRAFLVFCNFCHRIKKGKEWERNLAVKFTFGPWRNCVFRLWVEFCTVFIVAGFDCSVRLINFPLFATSALLFPDCVDFFRCQCPPILLMNPLGLQSIQIFAFYLYHTLSRISFSANSCADCWDFPFSRGIENYHWTILFLVKKAIQFKIEYIMVTAYQLVVIC